MATANKTLSLEEFRTQYGGRKPHFEYWFGEAVQKPTPTWLHAALQVILSEFLKRAGYKAGSELGLRIDPNWTPVPDVAGLSGIPETPYPTRQVDIVMGDALAGRRFRSNDREMQPIRQDRYSQDTSLQILQDGKGGNGTRPRSSAKLSMSSPCQTVNPFPSLMSGTS